MILKNPKQRQNFEDFDTPFPNGTRFPDTKEKIIAHALRLIANEGSKGFSLNLVLKNARVSKGSFFHHFRNLEALCLECFEHCKRLTIPTLKSLDFSSVQQFLYSFGEETFQRTQSKQFFRLIMFFGEKAMSSDKYLTILKELTESYRNSIVQVILEIDSSLVKERVQDSVSFLLIVQQGIVNHRIQFQNAEHLAKIWPISISTALAIMSHKEIS